MITVGKKKKADKKLAQFFQFFKNTFEVKKKINTASLSMRFV